MTSYSWTHQLDAFRFAEHKPASLLAMAMGTGKSKVAIDLLTSWRCRRALILSPVSVRAVWRREFQRWAPDRFVVEILEQGTVREKTRSIAERALHASTGPRGLAVVVNYESAWRDPLGSWILSQFWDAAILDESHRVKAHSTRISKFVSKLAARAGRRLCLTGTPMPHSPLDVFGQFRFLDWRLFGRRWTPFRASYARRDNPSIPQAITGYQNLDQLQQRFGRIAYQVSASVLDLPEVSHHSRMFRLPPKAARVYHELERDFFAQLESGVVTAANVLVKTLRLRQVVSGFVQPDDDDAIAELHTGKADLLADLLEDLGQPCVVFADFRHDLKLIRKTVEKLSLAYGELSGARKDLTEHATIPEGIDVLGVQYQSGGLGVDFSSVRYCLFFSPTYSLGNHEQALARVHRPGQRHPVHYYYLVAENTVDQTVYGALRKKADVIRTLLKGANYAIADRTDRRECGDGQGGPGRPGGELPGASQNAQSTAESTGSRRTPAGRT